jgi:hypothetical protein
MTFALMSAGDECYSLVYGGDHIGAVFSLGGGKKPWIAVLHDAWMRHNPRPPDPFTAREHHFCSLDELTRWLRSVPPEGDANQAATAHARPTDSGSGDTLPRSEGRHAESAMAARSGIRSPATNRE